MKHVLYGLALICLSVALSCSRAEVSPPNILLIVVDDLGWKDVGFMGSSYYETPHLDRLAREGTVFKQAYAAAANCAPSRACLMSGLYPTSHGIYTVASSERGRSKTRKIVPVENITTLRSDFYTLAEALQSVGYRTASMGKWHLGEDPLTQGFEKNVGGDHRGHPGSYFAPYRGPDLDAPEGEHLTDRLTREALTFIRDRDDRAFFLYLPYYAVHTPIQAKDSLELKYLEKGGRECQNNAAYAGMVDNLDGNIGLLLDELDRTGLRENTLVIFTSDNGGIRDISCQDPLRAGKGSYYEGGIRVPLVFSWPGQIEQDVWLEDPVINLDFYPTLLELTHQDPKTKLDGLSLWPLLNSSGELAERELYFHFPVYLQAYRPGKDDGRDPLFRTRPGSVIRKGEWKLHYYYEDGGTELYNLVNDPGERNNLAFELPEKTELLLTLLREWLDRENAPVDFQANPEFDSNLLDSLEALY